MGPQKGALAQQLEALDAPFSRGPSPTASPRVSADYEENPTGNPKVNPTRNPTGCEDLPSHLPGSVQPGGAEAAAGQGNEGGVEIKAAAGEGNEEGEAGRKLAGGAAMSLPIGIPSGGDSLSADGRRLSVSVPRESEPGTIFPSVICHYQGPCQT